MYDGALKGKMQKGHKRVLRGGGWLNNGRNLRSANRNANSPDNRNNNIGLRLAGALGTGGSINQRVVLFRFSARSYGQSLGPRRVSRQKTESLPMGRFTVEDCS